MARSIKKQKARQEAIQAPEEALQFDEFGFVKEATPAPAEQHIPMREQFPAAGSSYMGGSSDGWEYRSVFAGTKLAYTYEMVKQFLREEGYGDLPVPETVEDLRLFRKPRGRQLELFSEWGYAHNPIRILFPSDPRQRHTLILCLYNERVEKQLLRFHGLLK